MKNVMIAFEFPDDGKAPIGSMIIDIKYMTLTRKSRLVAGGKKLRSLRTLYTLVLSLGKV